MSPKSEPGWAGERGMLWAAGSSPGQQHSQRGWGTYSIQQGQPKLLVLLQQGVNLEGSEEAETSLSIHTHTFKP